MTAAPHVEPENAGAFKESYITALKKRKIDAYINTVDNIMYYNKKHYVSVHTVIILLLFSTFFHTGSFC